MVLKDLEAYCMKCKKPQSFGKYAEYVTFETKRGTKAQYQGRCQVCGTKMCKTVAVI